MTVARSYYATDLDCTSALTVGMFAYVVSGNTVAQALAAASGTMNAIGLVVSNPTTLKAVVAYDGTYGGFTGLTAGTTYYLSNAGIPATTPGTVVQVIGVAASTTTLTLAKDSFLAANNKITVIPGQIESVLGVLTGQGDGAHTGLSLDKYNNVTAGLTAPATTSTDGFMWVPVVAGTPTGVPAHIPAGFAAICVDSTGNKIWAYEGAAWKGVGIS